MTDSSVIDDLAHRRDLRVFCEWARQGSPIPLARLQALANGSANPIDVERHGPGWLAALVDLAERAGLGALERDDDGAVVFLPATEPPSAALAWERATSSWL